jgi:hypothetical protein
LFEGLFEGSFEGLFEGLFEGPFEGLSEGLEGHWKLALRGALDVVPAVLEGFA